MKQFSIIFIFSLLLFIFSGCSTKPEIVIQEVYIPVKCKVSLKDRPKTDKIDSNYLKEVLKYTEMLENDLKFCIGEDNK